ncbi:hypothetical protein Mal52_29290 [Symmachiella dynata]|uniref:Uncharacterized protein n=1 Tax=Symmachiella dynata TaxID=2527995 RepID=A0A517ZPT5_9PLAN|nr:hypothetical protein [Symmachiella dynata]QDU44447.1 hypothetical protein Mal52_29290 [Symmachiella dynata]
MLHRLLKSLIPDPLPIDEVESIGDFIIPANDTILRPLHKFCPTYSYSERIKEIRGRNAIMRQIDGHPDLHDYLWERAGEDLPCDARWIVRAQAALAHPDTKVIFAIASGTHSIQIKIPVADMATFPEIKRADPTPETGSSVWIASRLNEAEDKRLLQIAYDAAGLTVS